ncbi:MAG: nitrogenase iron-molybdenum cofactor biosynthesis protein NifE, partial [Mesorhizobium sp.]
RQIDLAIHNPIWSQVRQPAPWDCQPDLIGELPCTRNETAYLFDEFACATAHEC